MQNSLEQQFVCVSYLDLVVCEHMSKKCHIQNCSVFWKKWPLLLMHFSHFSCLYHLI